MRRILLTCILSLCFAMPVAAQPITVAVDLQATGDRLHEIQARFLSACGSRELSPQQMVECLPIMGELDRIVRDIGATTKLLNIRGFVREDRMQDYRRIFVVPEVEINIRSSRQVAQNINDRVSGIPSARVKALGEDSLRQIAIYQRLLDRVMDGR